MARAREDLVQLLSSYAYAIRSFHPTSAYPRWVVVFSCSCVLPEMNAPTLSQMAAETHELRHALKILTYTIRCISFTTFCSEENLWWPDLG